MYDLKDSYGGNEIWVLNDEAIHDLAKIIQRADRNGLLLELTT